MTTGTYRIPIDPLNVEHAIAGHRPQLLPRERRLAVAELTRRGMHADDLAALIGCHVRTVWRHRAADRGAAR